MIYLGIDNPKWAQTPQNGLGPPRRTPFSIDFWKVIAISYWIFPLKWVIFVNSRGGTQGFLKIWAKNLKIDPFLSHFEPKIPQIPVPLAHFDENRQKSAKNHRFLVVLGSPGPLFDAFKPHCKPRFEGSPTLIFHQKSMKMLLFFLPIFL